MPQRFDITLVPALGLNVRQDPLLDNMSQSENGASRLVVYDAGGRNCEYTSKIKAATTVDGYQKYSSSSLSNPYQALHILNDGTNLDIICLSNGKFYYYDSSKAPVNVDAATPVTFSTTNLISLMQFGDYAVFGDLTNTPYKWKHGDTNLTKLIQSGTEYKFKYLESFQQRIFGCYSDQTDGRIDLRWTEPLPSFATLDFPSDNQLYKPDNDLGFTGIKRFGNRQCFVYGKKSILALDYYPNSTVEFGLSVQTTEIGCNNHWSIVDTGHSHIFYNYYKGFIEYYGGNRYELISEPILPWLETINHDYIDKIYGCVFTRTNEAAFFVPLENSSTCNAILYYNYITKQWRREDRAFCMGHRSTFTETSLTWNDMISLYGSTWPIGYTWFNLFAEENKFLGGYDGDLYTIGGTSENGSSFDAYRIEPVIACPQPERSVRLQEIRFYNTINSTNGIQVYWRGGETEQDCLSSQWEALGTTNSNWLMYCDKAAKFHQLKWGHFSKTDKFSVSAINLKGIIS